MKAFKWKIYNVFTWKGTTTAEEIILWKESSKPFNIKKKISSNISPNISENRDTIFIFIATLGGIGFVLLTAHLMVYIIDRRRRSISVTSTCESVPEQGSLYENINSVSNP